MPPPVRRADGDYHFHTYDYAGAVAFTPGPAQPNRNNMRFYSMERDLRGLLQEGQKRGVPNIALTTIGQSANNKEIRLLSFGNRNNNAAAPTVTFTGGIHAREWIAPEMVYLIAEYLIINYADQPRNRYAGVLKGLVDARKIRIIPMQNPDGNDHTVFGVGKTDDVEARFWRKSFRPLPTTGAKWLKEIDPTGAGNPQPFRKVRADSDSGDVTLDVPDYDPAHQIPPNAPAPDELINRKMRYGFRGVDLNRNFDTQAWGYDAASNSRHPNWSPKSEAYFGPRRNSESETQAIVGHLFFNSPAIMIDYHSHAQAILYPTEAFNNGAVNNDYIAAGRSLRSLTRSQDGQQYYALGTPLEVVEYNATGSITDHAVEQYAARGFTIELDGAPGSRPKSTEGFCLPESMIRMVFEKNIRGALVTLGIPDRVSWPNLVNDFLGWNVFGRGNRLPSAKRR